MKSERRFTDKKNFKKWQKKNKDACFHFCRYCHVIFTHDLDVTKCGVLQASVCENYNGKFCDTKVLDDKELGNIF